MGLRTMVTVNKLSYPACWVRSKDRGHGVAVLSLGNYLGYFIFTPKFSGDLAYLNSQGVQFLFFPIFFSIFLFSPIFKLKPPFSYFFRW